MSFVEGSHSHSFIAVLRKSQQHEGGLVTSKNFSQSPPQDFVKRPNFCRRKEKISFQG